MTEARAMSSLTNIDLEFDRIDAEFSHSSEAHARPIAFYPLMAIEAARKSSKIGGGYRLYIIAKALDAQGLGMIERKTLRAFVYSLGLPRSTYKRWLQEATYNGYIVPVKDGDWYRLPSVARAAVAMGLDYVGPRKATIAAGDLIGAGWKARIYSAWGHGKQITREQIQKELNITTFAQRYRDNQANTIRQRNYAKSKITGDKITMVREHNRHKGAFVLRDGFIAWRLPDIRFSTVTERGAKGRARKVNRYIKAVNNNGLSIVRRALCDDSPSDYLRLFNTSAEQLKATSKKIIKRDWLVPELYLLAGETQSGAGLWEHKPA